MSEILEKTLAIIKPDAVQYATEIEEIMQQEGFTILQKRNLQLSPEQASEFYEEHFGKAFFHDLITYMTSGPIMVYSLARDDAIAQWRKLIGPTNTSVAQEEAPESLRAKYGTDDGKNGFHGSDSPTSADRELKYFFPGTINEPVMTGQAAKDYLAETVNPTLLKGLTQLCKNKPSDPIIWLADWLLMNNPNKPLTEECQPQSDAGE